MPKKIVIATRESALALWQANFIRDSWRNYTRKPNSAYSV